jgi:hypothetical protein
MFCSLRTSVFEVNGVDAAGISDVATCPVGERGNISKPRGLFATAALAVIRYAKNLRH